VVFILVVFLSQVLIFFLSQFAVFCFYFSVFYVTVMAVLVTILVLLLLINLDLDLKSIRQIKIKLQETIKPNISNKNKNILGVDRVE